MNPWISIWLKPRQTIRHIVETNPRQWVVPLAVAGGAAGGVMNMEGLVSSLEKAFGKENLQPVLFAAALLVGGLFGWCFLYLFGWLYRWVGSWFGGQAKNVEVRAAIAWVKVPTLALFVLWLLLSFLPTSTSSLAMAFGVVGLLIAIWQTVLLSKTLGEVHRFSAWKGLGTLIIPNLFLAIPAFVAILLAIAIPNVLRGRMSANEAAAIGNTRVLISSLEMYRLVNDVYPVHSNWGQMYPPDREAYGPPDFHTTGQLVNHEAQGFLYTYRSQSDEGYTITAVPKELHATGVRAFYADQTGVIHHCIPKNQGETAHALDQTIDQSAGSCSNVKSNDLTP